MKKLLTLFVFVFLFSCDNDDTNENAVIIDPTLLQKVVFSPGTPFEKHWNFYENGLLKEVTNASGTIVNAFTYDANGNLLAADGHTFTYENDIVTSVDGYPVAYGYDAAGGKYTFEFAVPDVEDAGIDFPHKTEIVVNSDLLPVSRKIFYNYPDGEIFYQTAASTYQNGNLKVAAQMDGDTYQRFDFDSSVNPFKAALLPICRVMVMVNPNYLYGGSDVWHNGNYSSTNNVVGLQYALEDPESNTFNYTFNVSGFPTAQISQSYSNGQIEGAPMTTIRYYYQGDDLP